MNLDLAGTMLKQARLKHSLSIEDVAEKTNIREHYLISIEEGEQEDLPAEVYLRAFLRSYAKAVDIDPDQVIDCYELPPAQVLTRQEERPSVRERKRTQLRKQRITAAIVAILVIVAFIVYYYYFKN